MRPAVGCICRWVRRQIVGNSTNALTRIWSVLAVGLVVAAVVASGALGAAAPISHRSRLPKASLGAITQLSAANGCLVDRSSRRRGCTTVRALKGAGPIIGSEAITVSPDGSNVYVASSSSNAIAVFKRNRRTGKLTQASGTAGCIAAGGADGCARGRGLAGPNSVAVSADGKNLYATSFRSSSVDTFTRDPSTGALTQAKGSTGCLTAKAIPGCASARGLNGADVVALSDDGRNVYVGAFRGSAVAVFSRSTSVGTLTQSSGTGGCISEGGADGCATARAMSSVEGLAVTGDGKNMYAAAPGSGALDVLARDPSTGALTQPADDGGCFVNSATTGCTLGRQLDGADAVAISPDDRGVYVPTLLSSSIAIFTRTPSTGQLAQASGTTGCVANAKGVGCARGRTLRGAEGVAVSPEGTTVYAVSLMPGSIDVFDRTGPTAALTEKRGRQGCLTDPRFNCARAQPLRTATSVAVSPDGKNVYVVAFKSNALDAFKRQTK
ncbi:MAG: beta-propeller fold lactonase family protein [Solirubrobacterales bacterium]|nr:beta-propeller fold lactonase family protein [Solirubrobacterales bacterium]